MKKSIKIGLLSIAGLIVLGAILPDPPPEEKSEPNVVAEKPKPKPKVKQIDLSSTDMLNRAYTRLRLEVKSQLISPKNADFPALLDIQYTSRNDSSYLIDSYVDTKNTYNAEVRLKFTGEVKYTGGDFEDYTNWQVTRLEYE